MTANTSPLKRTFGDIDSTLRQGHGSDVPYMISSGRTRRSISPPAKRRSLSISRSNSMPVETTTVVPPTFPSFASVFGSGPAGQDQSYQDTRSFPPQQHGAPDLLIPSNTQPQPPYPPPAAIQHRDSINSLGSDSTDSSPTTTMSTFDSPSVTEESPSSSPESPSSALPLAHFKAMMRSPDAGQSKDTPATTSPEGPPLRSDSPGGLGKNVKNLSLNMAAAAPRPTTSTGAGDGLRAFSAPASPLQAPLKTGRKKPTNLTIRTPGFDQLSFAKTNSASDIPPTPGQRLISPQIQSSPALSVLMSPRSLINGMSLPLPPLIGQMHSRPGSQSSLGSQSVTTSLPEVKEEDPAQPSQETQERGYVNGPVQIYDGGVFLFLEPSCEEASQFDTVINCAKEIRNPFEGREQPKDLLPPNLPDRAQIPEPLTAVSEISFKSAFEWPRHGSDHAETPTTPQASANVAMRVPEYLHVPWDHNSEIIDDLYPLCKIIDDRVAAGKTVLIHCQLGVSRSASLVIAYGLYKDYQSNFHSMYGAVKERSQWVGPNMSLIYQLGDFRKNLDRGQYAKRSREAPAHWWKHGKPASEDIVTPTNAANSTVLPPPSSRLPAPAPLMAPPSAKPLPPLRLNKELPPVPSFSTDTPVTLNAPNLVWKPTVPTPATSSATPPSKPTSKFDWFPTPSKLAKNPSSTPDPPKSGPKRTASRPLPLRERISPTMEIPPHRPRKPGLSIFRPAPAPQMDLAVQDEPATPSLFSPRATEFMASSFGATVAGDLIAGPTSRTVSSPPSAVKVPENPTAVDPRSPHQRDDTGEILRSIDDVL